MVEDVLVRPDVSSAQKITRLLDEAGASPKAVIWVYGSDTDRWRLWIVPRDPKADAREFYRELSILLAKQSIGSVPLDIGSIHLVGERDPAVTALAKIIRVEGVSEFRLTGNVLDNIYLPDVIIVRIAL